MLRTRGLRTRRQHAAAGPLTGLRGAGRCTTGAERLEVKPLSPRQKGTFTSFMDGVTWL